MADTPEIHPVHKPHRAGLGWLELILSVSAIVTSVVSVYIAIQHGKVMEKLVASNSLPYLEVFTGNALDDEPDHVKRPAFLFLRNAGVGPARVDSLQLTGPDGRRLRSLRDMAAACCTAAEARSLQQSYVIYNLARYFIPARDVQRLFVVRKTPGNGAAWDKFDRYRNGVITTVCYCSVFDECYRTDSRSGVSTPVRTCRADPSQEFRPQF